MYTCKYCGKEFESSAKCNGHIARCVESPANKEHIQCEFCGKIITGKISYSRHRTHCSLNPDGVQNKSPQYRHDVDGKIYSCKFCNKIFKNTNSLINHERLCASNPEKATSNLAVFNNQVKNGEIDIWNKGQTKETNSSVAKQSETVKRLYATGELVGNFLGKHHPQHVKDKIAASHRLLDHDQVNKNSHGKRGWLDGMFFMSTWEVAYYLYMRDSGHIITRCSQKFEYEYEDKLHTYTPDFLVDNKTIVEVKGYETDVDRLKYTLVPDLVIIDESKINPYLQYVKNTYKTTSIEELYAINLSK